MQVRLDSKGGGSNLRNPEVFGDIEEAMVKLGLGKNMVQSLRFWVQALRVPNRLVPA